MKAEEIKFKGIRVHNGEWVYGCMVINTETDTYRIFSSFANVVHGDFTDDGLHYCSGQLDVVYPETVCQFTGLKDKNGVEIYEGDIINIGEIPDKQHFIVPDIRFMNDILHEVDRHVWLEVIGNIYDKYKQKQALIDTMRGDEQIGLYDDKINNNELH